MNMKTTPTETTTTEEPVSRQRAYQLRHMEAGLCISCSRPAIEGAVKCKKHLKATREGLRKRFSYRKRYRGSKSYEPIPPREAVPA